jgi:outer membrane autotransporter protein
VGQRFSNCRWYSGRRIGASDIRRYTTALPLGLFLIFTGTTHALAVSSGCLAVRGGALNAGGADLNFNGTFDTGETVVWTFTGAAPYEVSVTPPGAAFLPVVGGIATFTFPATGAFLIQQTAGVVTATCSETTAEKQDAVKNAVKTLTEMQLTQSMQFQSQLLQELAALFISGRTPSLLLGQLEPRLAALKARQARIDSSISAARNAIATNRTRLPFRRRSLRLAIAGIPRAEAEIAKWLEVRASIQRQLGSRYGSSSLRKRVPLNRATLARARSELARGIRVSNWKKWIPILESWLRVDGPKYDRLQRAIRPAERSWASATARKIDLERLAARLPGVIAAMEQSIAINETAISNLTAERNSLAPQIATLEAQIQSIKSQISQQANPYASVYGQGAPGLTSTAGYSPHGFNPLRFKSAGGQSVSFFADLNTLRSQSQDALDAAGGNPKYNIWASGNYADLDSDQVGADRQGHSYTLATGAYVAPNAKWMIGAMYRYRDATSSSVAQDSDISTYGHGVGVHSTLVLSPTLSFSAQALYERSQNDLIRAGASGSFDANQLVASGLLQGSFTRGLFWLRPSVAVTYAYVDQEAFTDSTGTAIAGQITELGQVTFGPSIGWRIQRPGETVTLFEPSLFANGVWTFKDAGDTTLASGTIVEQDNVAAQLGGGLKLGFSNGANLSFNGSYAGFGASEVATISGGGKLTIPLGGP